MIKWLLSLFSILLIDHAIVAQEDTTRVAHNAIYFELGGPAVYGSLNYERMVLLKKELALIARCGIGFYHIKDYTNKFNPDILIPLSLSGSYGKKHKIEAGVGQTLVTYVRATETNSIPVRETNFHTFFSIGYRYQKTTGGLLLRCNYTPIIEFNRVVRHWAGVSVGYLF